MKFGTLFGVSNFYKWKSLSKTVHLDSIENYGKNDHLLNQSLAYSLRTRSEFIADLESTEEFDVLIIGGGATGVGTLLACSQKGLKAVLIESNDFASATSSKSTKLLHGGIRYLQRVFKFGNKHRELDYELVKEALTERNLMLNNAPYMTNQVAIVIPATNIFKAVYYYLGCRLYDYLSRRNKETKYLQNLSFSVDAPRLVLGKKLREIAPDLQKRYKYGVVYFDGQFNDSKMAVETVLTATAIPLGSDSDSKVRPPADSKDSPRNIALNYMKSEKLLFGEYNKVKGALALDRISGKRHKIMAKKVINATGTFSDNIRRQANGNLPEKMVLSKGEHISLEMLRKADRTGLETQGQSDRRVRLQPVASQDGPVPAGVLVPRTKDGRVLFVLNWEDHWIAGTTDRQEPKTKLASHVPCDQQGVDQITYELHNMFDVEKTNVLSKWAGHRPLIKAEGSSKELARTHLIEVDQHSGLISILGGKWTIFRKMGEEGADMALVEMLRDGLISEEQFEAMHRRTTKNLRFIGDFREKSFDLGVKQEESNKAEYTRQALSLIRAQFPGADERLIRHLYKNYGMRSEFILKEISGGGKKAQIFDEESMLSYAEVEHLLKFEFCTQTLDVVGRRSRLAFLDNQKARE